MVCGYGRSTALEGISLTVGQGQLVALIGANGAGKTTTLRAISGLLHPPPGRIVSKAHDITRASRARIRRSGIAHCPEGRHVFPQMTVRRTWTWAAICAPIAREIAADMTRVFEQFPRLAERAAAGGGHACPAASSRCWRSAGR